MVPGASSKLRSATAAIAPYLFVTSRRRTGAGAASSGTRRLCDETHGPDRDFWHCFRPRLRRTLRSWPAMSGGKRWFRAAAIVRARTYRLGCPRMSGSTAGPDRTNVSVLGWACRTPVVRPQSRRSGGLRLVRGPPSFRRYVPALPSPRSTRRPACSSWSATTRRRLDAPVLSLTASSCTVWPPRPCRTSRTDSPTHLSQMWRRGRDDDHHPLRRTAVNPAGQMGGGAGVPRSVHSQHPAVAVLLGRQALRAIRGHRPRPDGDRSRWAGARPELWRCAVQSAPCLAQGRVRCARRGTA